MSVVQLFEKAPRLGDEKQDDALKWEWSAKHTRLRYQTFIAAIIFYYVSAFQINDFKVPLIFASIEDGEGPTKPMLVVGVATFYIFSLFSFWLRSHNERKMLGVYESQVSMNIDYLRNKIGRVVEKENELRQDSVYDFPNFSQIKSKLDELELGLVENLSMIYFTNSKIEQIKWINDAGISPSKRLEMFRDTMPDGYNVDKLYKLLNKHGPLNISKEYLDGLQRYLKLTDNAVVEMRKIIEEKASKSDEMLKKYYPILNEGRQSLIETMTSVDKSVEKLLAKESRLRKAHFVEREVFGFWLPALVSFGVFTAAICTLCRL